NDLNELFSRAKPETVAAASDAILKFPVRSAYMEFAILMGLNGRDRDIPIALLTAFAKSKDAIVRQTAALMLGHTGRKQGLELLFSEIEPADARGCELIMGKLD